MDGRLLMNPSSLPDVFFAIVMIMVVTAWVSLIFFPRSHRANFWYAGVIVPTTLSVVYMYFLLAFWFVEPAGHFYQFESLKGVYALFGNNGLLLVGWINIIAMDIVLGAWMARKAAQVRMPYIYLLPCLILTFAFAGLGFTIFTIVMAVGGRWSAIAKLEGAGPEDGLAPGNSLLPT
jgi:ABA DEFICIENT 4-like